MPGSDASKTSTPFSSKSSNSIPKENLFVPRGDCLHADGKNFKGNLEFSVSKWDHGYCRVSPRISEYQCGLGVPPCSRLFGVEVETSGVEKVVPKVKNFLHRDSQNKFKIIILGN